jgi:hypothetical protein
MYGGFTYYAFLLSKLFYKCTKLTSYDTEIQNKYMSLLNADLSWKSKYIPIHVLENNISGRPMHSTKITQFFITEYAVRIPRVEAVRIPPP